VSLVGDFSGEGEKEERDTHREGESESAEGGVLGSDADNHLEHQAEANQKPLCLPRPTISKVMDRTQT
jgi:hypothetical protein